MALSLNQIKKKRRVSLAIPALPQKSHVTRPWETFDKLGNQTRTVTAREAVDKARIIVPVAPLFISPLAPVINTPMRKLNTTIRAGSMFDFLSSLF